jgi:transcriptional regulator GlxA family with amidase domain
LIRRQYEEKLTVKKIASALGIASRQLSGAFREEWGLPIKHYLIRVRIENAMKLLRETNLPIKAIASRVGYPDLANFYKHFHRMTHRTPSEFRELPQV